jgi:hypothetical protein
MTSIKILLGALMCLNLGWSYFNSTTAEKIGNVDVHLRNHNPDYTFYGGDIYYIDGKRLYSESGEVDTVFNTKKDLSIYLEQASADSYKEALAWELDRFLHEYTNVLVYGSGEVYFTWCNPYSHVDADCFELLLNAKDCDQHGSCLYYNKD